MTDNPKESGKSKIKRWLNKSAKDKNIKHITLAISQAKEIMDELKMDNTKPEWSLKSNSLKAGATVLCIDPKELLERLTSDKPSKLRNELAEARNKLNAVENFADLMFNSLSFKEQELLGEQWVKIKNLYR